MLGGKGHRPCGPDRVRDPGLHIHFTYDPSSFLASNSFTSCGFACPFDAFITWPTKNPIMVFLPERYCSICLGFAAMISSTIFSSAEVSVDCCGRPSSS